MACFIDTLSALTNGGIAAIGGVRVGKAALCGMSPAGPKGGRRPVPFRYR